jgi:hypothetical protein
VHCTGWIEMAICCDICRCGGTFAHTDTHVVICLCNALRFDLFGWCIDMKVTRVTRASCPPGTLMLSQCWHVAVPCSAPSRNIAPKVRRFSGVDSCVSLETEFASLQKGVWEPNRNNRSSYKATYGLRRSGDSQSNIFLPCGDACE